MTHHPEHHRHHPIRILHVLVCLAIAGGFAWYAWQHHPSRAAFRTPAPSPAQHAPRSSLPTQALSEKLSIRLALVRAVLPDVIAGLGILGLFSLGTGVYARRFEVWLEVHRSGEAAALRGLGLDRAALGANKDRKKGASL